MFYKRNMYYKTLSFSMMTSNKEDPYYVKFETINGERVATIYIEDDIPDMVLVLDDSQNMEIYIDNDDEQNEETENEEDMEISDEDEVESEEEMKEQEGGG